MKTTTISIRVSPEEHEAIAAAARRMNRKVSDWARLTLLVEAKYDPEKPVRTFSAPEEDQEELRASAKPLSNSERMAQMRRSR